MRRRGAAIACRLRMARWPGRDVNSSCSPNSGCCPVLVSAPDFVVEAADEHRVEQCDEALDAQEVRRDL